MRHLKAAIQDELDTKNLRQEHQNTLLWNHEAAGNSKLAQKIRGIQRVEETKQVFKKCQHACHRREEGGLNHVLVPNNPDENPRTCMEWRRVDCPTELIAILQARNREHFGQSKHCTWTSPPLDFTMDFSATSTRAEAILEGTFLQLPRLDSGYERVWLWQMGSCDTQD